ncbi:hypothetical protein [Amycolatopsis alkalitolerans]|uniref:Uncharacterized protein n=1 Tax=Amycolatopsis alkalitolerans TaxID=2547244 RepID=A0A5C4M425_9PSEU|nr:hypothetical protein [Amycolatopsis alkalitolerans]TNC27289.1 hypothetical protein FG385_09390 [Amycolatopsis alkalitolerans]
MWNILAGVVGAAVSLAGVLLGAWLKSRNEHRSWLREQKLKSAADLIAAVSHLYESQRDSSDQSRLTPADRVAWQDKLQTGRSIMHLLCRDETRESASAPASFAWQRKDKNVPEQADVVKALQAFNVHVRREIRSDR